MNKCKVTIIHYCAGNEKDCVFYEQSGNRNQKGLLVCKHRLFSNGSVLCNSILAKESADKEVNGCGNLP